MENQELRKVCWDDLDLNLEEIKGELYQLYLIYLEIFLQRIQLIESIFKVKFFEELL